MKKIIALILMLSMAAMLTACGGADASSFYGEKYDYVEKLAEAVDAGDTDEINDIKDEIKAYWSEFDAEFEIVEEELEDAYKDEVRDMDDTIGSADLTEGAMEAIREMKVAFNTAESHLSKADVSAYEDLMETLISYYEDIASAAADDDSDEVKSIAREARDAFKEINAEYDEAFEEYEMMLEELRDEYSSSVVAEAEALYNEAMYSGM